MESHLWIYAMATLSRQFPKTSVCRHTQRRMQTTASRSSNRLLCQHQAPSPAERNCRHLHTQHRHSAVHDQSPRQAYSTKFESTKEYNSPTGLKNGGQGQAGGKQIAILGSGISGLATAVYLRTLIPTAIITIYEASGRHGGWIRSKRVRVLDGYVTFELGPRALMPHRPNSLPALHLVMDMGLASEIIWKHKHDPASINRFIYYPDHLVQLPGGDQDIYQVLTSLMTEPLYNGLFKGAMHELVAPARSPQVVDETVSTFFRRRFGNSDIAENLVSAVMHGIYAGDIDRLSMRSIMSHTWNMEGTARSVLLGSVTSPSTTARQTAVDLSSTSPEPDLQATLQTSARSYSLKDGLQSLPDRIKAWLQDGPNINFRMRESVTDIKYDEKSDGILLSTSNNQPPVRYDQCISALPAATLATLTPHLPSLSRISSVTVMVVNLFYEDADLLREHGFGYLIPRSIPADQNPECALGVTFDGIIGTGVDTVPGTKLSVILGGHYWDGFTHYPTREEGVAMAKSIVKRHLGINAEPAAVLAMLHKDCIPQYHIGHGIKLAEANKALDSHFNGRLSVVGNSYDGVGVNDCIQGAVRLVTEMASDPEGRATGLERHRFTN